jgi:predicted dienelactone hydrolase
MIAPLLRRLPKLVALVSLIGLAGAGALLVSLWVERRTEIALPSPTGPLPVGRSVYDWRDLNKPVRELLVWIWYPAEATGASPDDYVPGWMLASAGRAPFPFALLTRELSKVRGHSLRDPEISRRQQSYPVVIMRAGASAEVWKYTTLAEDLASHGYVVLGFDAPYRTFEVAFPDGRVYNRKPENNPELYSGAELNRVASRLLEAWTGDIDFVLDRLGTSPGKFAGRLDLSRVGVFGHSFGGATAAQFCSRDSRCKAGIDIDGSLHGSVIQEGIHKPFLFLLSDHGDFSSDAETRQIKADIQSVYDRLPADGRLLVSIRGANHFTFSDDGALLKSHILRSILRLFGMLGIDGRRQVEVTAYCVHTFFDSYLKGAGDARARISPSVYPEIQVLD